MNSTKKISFLRQFSWSVLTDNQLSMVRGGDNTPPPPPPSEPAPSPHFPRPK